jgi:hypothetical protein
MWQADFMVDRHWKWWKATTSNIDDISIFISQKAATLGLLSYVQEFTQNFV